METCFYPNPQAGGNSPVASKISVPHELEAAPHGGLNASDRRLSRRGGDSPGSDWGGPGSEAVRGADAQSRGLAGNIEPILEDGIEYRSVFNEEALFTFLLSVWRVIPRFPQAMERLFLFLFISPNTKPSISRPRSASPRITIGCWFSPIPLMMRPLLFRNEIL